MELWQLLLRLEEVIAAQLADRAREEMLSQDRV